MRLLYLAYWGVHDPLTVSTVYPHLDLLSAMPQIDAIYFYTIERTGDKEPPDKFLKHEKIRWEPIISSHGLKSKFSDFTIFPKKLQKVVREQKISCILCRSTPAGALGYIVSKKTGVPFLVESYEPHADYMLQSGVWKPWDPRYLLSRYWEKQQKRHAEYLITVSENYKNQLIREGLDAAKILVAPCAVPAHDFRFDPGDRNSIRKEYRINNESTVGIYVGKFGDIYYDKEAFKVFRQTFDFFPGFVLTILSGNSKEWIIDQLRKYNIPLDRVIIEFVSHQEVPKYLSAADFGFSLIRYAPSRKYCSPIKDGEYWANGLPILLTKDVGDDADIIVREKAGALFHPDMDNIDQSLTQIQSLMGNEQRERISHLATKYRSFDAINTIYHRLFSN